METTNFQLEDVYVERCTKETEETIKEETAAFLKEPLTFLKRNKHEFIYTESPAFETVKVDGISLELDDVFGIYNALLGYKVQKKHEQTIKNYLDKTLTSDDPANYGINFNHDDGLWDINIALNYIPGFHDEITLEESVKLILNHLKDLLDEIESTN
jgi:predicted NACHT family NTPase